MSLVANYGVSSDESEDENQADSARDGCQSETSKSTTNNKTDSNEEVLEDFVKKVNYGEKLPEKPPPKPLATAALSKMRLPAAKGKVKITIPKIQDSDSDEDVPAVKKPKNNPRLAGFLGSLPAPRSSLGGKEVGRSLIPHTLTKKPAETKAKAPSLKPATVAQAKKPPVKPVYTHGDSDEEVATGTEEPGTSTNFFSLDSESSNNLPMTIQPQTSKDFSAMPLAFSGGSTSVSAASNLQENQPKITAASLYNMSNEDETYEYEPVSEPSTEQSSTGEQDLLNSEEFLRLQGKKQRGREEINIIDVSTEDMKASELELTKNLSQEISPAAYSHRRKGHEPSGQQKRKHQITYLAFQAKQRELELKNTWAANRMNKQQTQAKYGF